MQKTGAALSNLSVDSDTLRQGAARRRRISCTSRRLAATCRSPLRCTGTVAPLSPESMPQFPGLRPLEANRSVWWSRPRLVVTPRTAATLVCVGAQRPSLAWWPKEAEHSIGVAADAVGSRLSQTSVCDWRPSVEAAAGTVGRGRCGLSGCERHAQELQRRARYNRSVDADTLRQGAATRRQRSCTLRPLAATCRSPLR